MKLREWREQNGVSQQQVADSLNALKPPALATISQGSVDRWEKGTIPRQENIRLVSILTKSAVTFADFYDEQEGPPKRRPRERAVSRAASLKGAQTMRRLREART